jgi:large subunit ribosomal protein L3
MIHRQPASNGDTNAGRTVLGSRRPGHYGVDRTTCQNLEVVRADGDRNLLLVRGAVPGGKNALVLVRQSVKSRRPSTVLRMTKPGAKA